MKDNARKARRLAQSIQMDWLVAGIPVSLSNTERDRIALRIMESGLDSVRPTLFGYKVTKAMAKRLARVGRQA